MEIRKAQRTGYSALNLSLPIDRIKESGLKPGDRIFLHREEIPAVSLKKKVNDKVSGKTEDGDEVVVYSDCCSKSNRLERIIDGNYYLTVVIPSG